MLTLTLEVEMVNGELCLILEDSTLPTADRMPVSRFLQLLESHIIDTVVLVGRSVMELVPLISNNGRDHPTIVFIDTIIQEEVDTIQEYFIRVKQQELTDLYLLKYCECVIGQ